MSLPLLAVPKFELELPSNKEKITFRPFLVKEEKVLLIAQESGEESDITKAIKDIINSCVLSGKINVDKMPSFDLEYLFLNIRAKSVGEVVELKYRHVDGKNKAGKECDHIQDVEINLETIEVNFPEEHTNKIEITPDIGVSLKYPTFGVIEKYSKTMKFPVIYEHCPCSVDAFRRFLKGQLDELEKENPSVKLNIVNYFIDNK